MKKNSLVKKGLTIFDVIQPTSVLVKEPQYIQVIDKYVLAKVWDDVRRKIFFFLIVVRFDECLDSTNGLRILRR